VKPVSNVVKFPNLHSDCFEYILSGGKINGLFTICKNIEITLTVEGLVRVESDHKSHIDRETMAEFLWAAAIFFDSEERFKPEGEIVGLDYE